MCCFAMSALTFGQRQQRNPPRDGAATDTKTCPGCPGMDPEVNIGHGLILWPFFHGEYGDVSVYIYIHHRLDGSLTNDFFRGGL